MIGLATAGAGIVEETRRYVPSVLRELCRYMEMSSPIFDWFLPTSGDGRDAADSARSGLSTRRSRGTDIGYLAQVAQAADYLGFEGALTPVGTSCEEPWILTAALARETRSLKFLVAMRPSSVSPTLTAQMAATFQNVSGGRLALNIVAGGDAVEMQRFGDWLDHDQRYARTDEFLTVLRGAWDPDGFTFTGDHYDVRDARVLAEPEPPPLIYFGGASPPAEDIAARHADVYLAWGEPPDMLAERVARVRALAERHERQIRFGVRLHVITRDTAEEAWTEADRMLREMPDASVKLAQRRLRKMDSVGQQRLNALHGGSKDNLLIAPNLWAGISLIRGHGSTALVGSHEEIAQRIRELQEIGFDEFIFGGLPHLEEAYRFAEGVMPLFEVDAQAALVA
jgi:alkanesulfonate monooxygenase